MAQQDRIAGLIGSLGMKPPCRVATTANITLSGLQTIDDVAVVADDRVLVKNQTDAVENGIYYVTEVAWERAPDFDGTRDVRQGTAVAIASGTINARAIWQLTTVDPVIGTSELTFGRSENATLGTLTIAELNTSVSDADIAILGANTFTGAQTISGAPINLARSNITQHATTMNLWAATVGNALDGTGAGVTITAITDAPQAGASRDFYPLTGTVLTQGAMFDIDGGLSRTATAGECWTFVAKTVSTYRVFVRKADGTAVVAAIHAHIQPISASVASNALTISASAVSLDFRSTSLGSGTVTRVSGTPANLVISSGSTLGTTNGQLSRLVVLALNNAGTIELAVVNAAIGRVLDESGLISTTTEGGAGAADSATTIYSTTARTNVAYRVLGAIESTQATAGTWATAPSLIQGAGGEEPVAKTLPSMVRLHTANGYGSTNTRIRRFTTTITNTGTDITYADSAGDGASFTINTSGVYAISYSDSFTATGALGISLNSSQLTTNITSITTADILDITANNYGAGNYPDSAHWTGYLPATSVIRAHTDAGTAGGPASQFTIVRVA